MLPHAELLRLELELSPIRFSIAAHDGGVSGPDDEVDDIGETTDDLGQCANDGFDAFVGAQESEREQQSSTGHAKFGFERALITSIVHHGNAVRDDSHSRAANAVRALE